FGSDSLPSPVHLSWHCSQLLKTLTTTAENALPPEFELKVEFLMLLMKVHAESSPPVFQELYSFYLELLTEKEEPGRLHHKPSLSRQALQFLQKTLLHSSSLGHSLISQLLLPGHVSYQTSNQSLQKVYATCIRDLLAEIRKDIANSKEDTPEFDDRVENFITLLARWDPPSQTGDYQIERLFEDILDVLSKVSNKSLTLSVRSSLLARETSHLAHLYSKVQQRKLFQNLEDSVVLERSKLKDCSQDTILLVGLALEYDRAKAWETYSALVQEKQIHLLGEIVSTCLKFIQDGLFEELTILLQPVEFQCLKPLVLLIGWNYVTSSSSAEDLIQALCLNQMFCKDPLLNEACDKLREQVAGMRWCLETVRPLLPSPGQQVLLKSRASRMFQDLDSHSILSMLHRLTGLGQLDQDVVLKLLKQRPEIKDGATKTDTKKTKSVRFADDKDVDQLPLEQERDVVIYSSFLISKYFLEAILAGVFHGPKLSSEETDDSKQTEAESGQFLDECLTKVESGMAALYPLSYRVEILENLFSLLFLRYEDLSDGRDLHADSGEEEGLIEDDLTNLSITSLESLSSPVKVAGASDMFDLQSRHGAISRRLNFTDGASQSKSDKMVTELDLSTKEASLGLGPISSSVQHKTKVKDNRKSETQDQGNQSSEAFLLEASTGRHISSESLSQQSHLSTSQIGIPRQ
ncbi:hypothetical protein BSL78_28835, partial [Apostichopus japonicus]